MIFVDFFFIQKSKFQSVSCSVPVLRSLMGVQLDAYQCMCFLSKRILKLEPGAWCPVRVWILRPCTQSRGLGYSQLTWPVFRSLSDF